MATPAAPPLYLHITSQSKDGLERAIAKIEELMQQELPNLVDERRFRRREPEKEVERDELGRRKWPEERIPIDLEPIPGFNLRAQVVGRGGEYVKYIQTKTRCRVQIKGRGSGFTEHGTGVESDEPMYLHVAGPDPAQVQVAKTDCLELLKAVKTQYEEFKRHGPSYGRNDGGRGDQRGPSGGDRDRNGSGSYGGQAGSPGGYGAGYGYGGGYGSSQQYTPNTTSSSYGAPAAASPVAATPAGADADYSAAWAQYYQQGGQDPYAAYGGYEAYMQQYAQWQASQQSPVAAGTTYGAPGADPNAYNSAAAYSTPSATSAYQPPPPGAQPPPPGASAASPPPPPGSYNAVRAACS
jgi:hypothetical protein